MPAFKFFQTNSEGVWHVLEDRGHPATLNKALKAGAIKLSILSADTPEPELDKNAAKYKGPWYADIDCAGDIDSAAHSTTKLVEKLMSLDVPKSDIEIFASGKKGFHVIVNAKKFSDGRQRQYLPQIYKAMAAQLFVVGMDMGVYNGGMGTSWRIANIKRDDTGTYRVRITLEELSSTTSHTYAQLVENPRDFPDTEPDPSLSMGLRNLFIDSLDLVESQRSQQPTDVAEDLEKIRGEVPNCAEMVAEGKVLAEKNFNQVAMQMAAYIVKVRPSPMDEDRLRERFIDSMATDNHPARVRREAFDGLVGYVKQTPSFKFSCAGMRSILKFNKCKECPIYKNASNVDTAKKLGLEVRDDGYYSVGGDQVRRITSFVIRPRAVLKEYNHEGDKSVRTACIVTLQDGEATVPEVVWEENAWKGKSGLINMISGMRNFGFFGSDVDVQKIKNLVLEDEENMTEITRVYAAGMHIKRVRGRAVFNYVEPDFSVNSQGVRDLYCLTGAIPSAVNIGKIPVLDNSDEPEIRRIEAGLKLLLQVNSPLVVAYFLGWVSSCHLKVHIRNSASMANSFPLLSVHGSAQSGKNKTAELFTWLNGCTYGVSTSVFSVPSSKPYPLINILTTSTTIPRILDELNIERMNKTQFNAVVEVMKCSWDSSSVPRGTVGGPSLAGSGQTSARLIEQFITAPIIYCSEQEVTSNTALRQRSVSVHLSEKTREGRDQIFSDVLHYREDFQIFARYLVQSALGTSVDAIPELISANEHLIPAQITDRARQSLLILMLGLDFFQHNYKELGMDLDTEFTAVKQALIDYLAQNFEEITKEKNWSNIDTVINTYAIMASFHDDPKRQTLIPGQDYIYDEDSNRLYLASQAAHYLYKYTCSNMGETPLIATHVNFAKLIKEQPYYETDSFIDTDVTRNILGGKKCLVLKIDELKAKGIEVELFATNDMSSLV